MLKKRILFTLLYDNGQFMLSRNFRLQKVGNLGWLQQNYKFALTSFYIDELIVLDATRGERNPTAFCETLKVLTEGCFVPIAAGGGVRSVEHARRLLRSGADKVVVNTPLFTQPQLLKELAQEFGQQCVVGSLDMKRTHDGGFGIWADSGARLIPGETSDLLRGVADGIVGEWYLNSMDRDGTGQGFDLALLDQLPSDWSVPVILAGGAGNASHLAAALADHRVDAVATANLFNFVGDGLKQARGALLSSGVELASWPSADALLVNTHANQWPDT
jgi:imidazole glycerol-phosphate synthase subunit HisF